ncbi:hypothetical protein JOQ06_003055, partial [Pogonophryne albipinna]
MSCNCSPVCNVSCVQTVEILLYSRTVLTGRQLVADGKALAAVVVFVWSAPQGQACLLRLIDGSRSCLGPVVLRVCVQRHPYCTVTAPQLLCVNPLNLTDQRESCDGAGKAPSLKACLY